VYFEGEKEGVILELAMEWSDTYQENLFSFVNNINTRDGGTHVVGFQGSLDPDHQRFPQRIQVVARKWTKTSPGTTPGRA
jgi:DNA gyrase subunit B